jgi:iron complex outermembrane receptor protein
MINHQYQKNSQKTFKRLPIAVLCSILCLPVYANTENTQNINTLQEVKVEASKLTNTGSSDVILQQRYFLENNQYVDSLTQAKQVTRLNVTALPQLNQQQLITQDASVNLNYAPIGYYENYQIRGLPLDFDSGYYLNNMPISNRQMTSLENKQSIQINKGQSDEDALSSIGGGTINYISKRPENIGNINVGWKSNTFRCGAK